MTGMVALLRAVNVGGRKLPMTDLRAVCAGLGWSDVRSYIQSGNLVFAAAGKAAELETELESAILSQFGLEVPVILRSAAQWMRIASSNPFPEAARDEPSRLIIFVSKQPLRGDAQQRLRERAADGERIEASGGVLWCHFAGGAGRSKLTPGLIDRACGSPTTGRNHRTMLKLREMLDP